MTDDHEVRELGPADMAEAFAKRPGMYMGFPATLDRVRAFIAGFDMALCLTGDRQPLLDKHRELLQDRPGRGTRPEAQELAEIQRLVPALSALFEAAAERGAAEGTVASPPD